MNARLTALIFGAVLASAASAAPAAGPSVGHPLSPLCDMICGGTWTPDHPPAPDEFVTRMTFAYDPATQNVTGEIVRTGGFAGVTEKTTETFRYDASDDSIKVERTAGDGTTVSGTATIGTEGFQMRFDSPSTPGEAMLTVVHFDGADTWVERSEVTGNGQSALGTEERYVRKAE